MSGNFFGGRFFGGGFFGSIVQGGGTSKRKKRKTMRYSDLEARDALERRNQVFPTPQIVIDDDEDDVIIKLLARLLH